MESVQKGDNILCSVIWFTKGAREKQLIHVNVKPSHWQLTILILMVKVLVACNVHLKGREELQSPMLYWTVLNEKHGQSTYTCRCYRVHVCAELLSRGAYNRTSESPTCSTMWEQELEEHRRGKVMVLLVLNLPRVQDQAGLVLQIQKIDLNSISSRWISTTSNSLVCYPMLNMLLSLKRLRAHWRNSSNTRQSNTCTKIVSLISSTKSLLFVYPRFTNVFGS